MTESNLSAEQRDQIVETVLRSLVDQLESFGSRLTVAHKITLRALLKEMTDYAAGLTTGRKVFSLVTGGGKTSAIVIWIATLIELGHRNLPILIAAEKVEALCAIKRQLMDKGVPEDLIGLTHTLSRASLPSTDKESRLIQLVTHARVGSGRDLELMGTHQGVDRVLTLYDESLVAADPVVIQEAELRGVVANLKEIYRETPKEDKFQPLFHFLDRVITDIQVAISRCRANAENVSDLDLTIPDSLVMWRHLRPFHHRSKWDVIETLLEHHKRPSKLVVTKQGAALVFNRCRIPDNLRNVLVLDASYPLRALLKFDSTLLDCTPAEASKVRRYDQVTVHQMKLPSGRQSTFANLFNAEKTKRTMASEVALTVKSVPEDQAILIVTFKVSLPELKSAN